MKTTSVDNTGTTGFGKPFEWHLHHSYLVDTKGGNIPGYSAMFSIVPHLGLAVTVLVNSAYDELGAAGEEIVDPLVDALSEFYIANPTPGLTPPRGFADYLGTYSLGPTRVNITLGLNNKLQVTGDQSTVQSAVIAFAKDDTFVLEYAHANGKLQPPPGKTFPCVMAEALAMAGTRFVFRRNSQKQVVSLEVPGSAWNQQFKKQ